VELNEEVRRLSKLVDELVPFMLIDVLNGILIGPPPSGHPDDDCDDCVWYRESSNLRDRIEAGEFGSLAVSRWNDLLGQ
jgi:hypothetical protein